MTIKIISLVILLVATAPAHAQSETATLVTSEGSVEISINKRPVSVQPPYILSDGAQIKTGPSSTVIIMLANGSKLQIKENSIFVYTSQTAANTNVSLLKGVLTGWIKNMNARRLNVRTPTAVASVRGTVLSAFAAATGSHFELYEGSVLVTDNFGRSTMMSEGQRTEISSSRGLVGTSSLPQGTKPPIEPPVTLPQPPPPPPPQLGDKPKAKTPPPPPPGDKPLDGKPMPPPPPGSLPAPNPKQEFKTVSPSAP